MGIWQAHRNTATASHTGHWRQRARFLRHLGEMVLAMVLGMALLGRPYRIAMAAIGYSDSVERFEKASALVMTFNMTVPMVAWMRYRGHRWARAGEMAGAMFVPAVLIVLCIVGVIPHSNLSGGVIIAMLPSMLTVVLYRRTEYAHGGGHRQVASGPPPSRPVWQ
jgi:uncharacterized protein YjiS (DUF1127 family)